MFNLDDYINMRCGQVESTLDELMPPAKQKPRTIHRAMRYSVFSGGKRIRPVLCLAAAELVGAPPHAALRAAAAVELLHTYTLIHDDLPCMDNDDFRRGKPTSHRVFGEANAVLAGDALQALAFEILAGTKVPAPYQPCLLVTELARAAGSTGIVGGQVEDLEAAAGALPSRSAIAYIHLHKTADLFIAALRLGAITGGATAQQLTRLSEYGKNLGLAFQMVDDILDENQPAERHSGSGNTKELTCLSILTPAQARRQAARLVNSAIDAVKPFSNRATPLVAVAQFVLTRTH